MMRVFSVVCGNKQLQIETPTCPCGYLTTTHPHVAISKIKHISGFQTNAKNITKPFGPILFTIFYFQLDIES